MKLLRVKSIKSIIAFSLFAICFFAAQNVIAQKTPIKNVVLVHGAFVDGSGWRAVYDILTKKGYNVSIAQIPLTSLKDDVEATKVILDRLEGPVVLVGHSWGGAVITEAGIDQKVKSLVYVATFIPEVGETVGQLASSLPAAPENGILSPDKNGYLFYDKAKFHAGFAANLSQSESDFMADSQVPITAASFGVPLNNFAWKAKPSFAILTTQDKSLVPEIQRKMYVRAKSTVTEIKANHAVFISHPEEVAAVIIKASLVK